MGMVPVNWLFDKPLTFQISQRREQSNLSGDGSREGVIEQTPKNEIIRTKLCGQEKVVRNQQNSQ